MTKVKTHFVDIRLSDNKWHMCLAEPKYINYLLLKGYTVFDYTTSLATEPYYVEKKKLKETKEIPIPHSGYYIYTG